MPVHRHIRQRTGNHRKRPLRDCQEQYRWKRGLDVLDITLQSALQTQILCCTRFSQGIITQSAALIAEAELLRTPVEREAYLDEADTLLMMHGQVIQPTTRLYSDQETELADIMVVDDRADHYYGVERNRSIGELSDYVARRYTRFSKDELWRIYRLFNIGDKPIRIACSTTQDNFYMFSGEEISLFGVAKLATGDFSDKLCCDVFGGSPRRWCGTYMCFLYYIHDHY